jgi:antitoxin HicB
MLAYAVTMKVAEEGGFVVTFPDFPEAITQGEDVEDALRHGADVLESAIDWYIREGKPVPAPSKRKRGQRVIELPASYAAKILLLNEMALQQVRPAELARRMKVSPQEINRLLNVRHATKIDGIASALKALGKTMEIRAA